MQICKLAIAAPTSTAFARSALDQSVPRVSPTTPSPTDTSGNSMRGRRERGTVTAPGEIPERGTATAPPATTGSDVVRDPRPIYPLDTRAPGWPAR
jgi:hypothetical protein